MKKFSSILLLVLLSFAVYSQKRTYELPKGIQENQYDGSTIIVKFKSIQQDALKANKIGKATIVNRQKALPFMEEKLARTAKPNPLSNIYKVQLAEGEDIFAAINAFLQMDNVEYAEPYFNYRPLFIPNDPEANPSVGKQTYLSVIRAYDAWTLERGDSSIVIGILDTGVQQDHDEFSNQIAYNYNDPINGIDDDNDGLIDNFAGWDIANNDNNPLADTDPHGSQITGLSSARTNNGIGIAGTGFNSKFMPIKIFASGTNIFHNGYEAIALAADLGCKVINLSWGSPDSYSQFGQDIINYAVLEKDVVIVAAAGNTPDLLDFYPASYDNVLSVGASTMTDEKADFSTFSYNIDLMAPGKGIYATNNNNSYINNTQGTSFSAPLVAGAAALVRAREPGLTAQQVMERLRVTADDIYTIPTNTPFEGTLGKGRLNMLKALTDNVSPSLRVDSMEYNNGIGELAYAGDTLSLQLSVRNYLTTTTNAKATLTSLSPYASIIQDKLTIGKLSTLATFHQTQPFTIILTDDLPPNQVLIFRVSFEDGVYEDFQYLKIVSAPNHVNVGDNLRLTVAGDGDLGYDEDFKYNGLGVEYEGQNVLDNIGLIVATSQNAVSDNAPVNLSLNTHDHDFTNVKSIKQFNNGIAPIDVRSIFSIADSIRIEQKSVSNSNASFIIQEYRMLNTGNTTLNNVNVSLFADWNIGNKDFNTANWDGVNKLGYVNDGTTYMGIALLSSQDSIYSAINNRNFNGNIADIPILLNDSVKFSHSSQGILKESAGTQNGGNDVSHFIGGTIQNLPVNGAEKVVFAFVAGHSLSDLQNTLTEARTLYNDYYQNPPLIHVSETCPGEPASINPEIGTNFDFYEDVALNNLLYSGETFVTPNITVPTTYYVINKDNSYNSDIYRVIAKPKAVDANFSASQSPLLLDETGKTGVVFTDKSIDGITWQWDFDNGFTSILQNPNTNFTKTGVYNVSLTVTSDLGCQETIVTPFTVANRSNKPNINDVDICKGDEVTLTATNATNLEFYADADLTEHIFSGYSFTEIFSKDTTLYVISNDSVYVSNIKSVFINVDDVKAGFKYHPDTTDLTSNKLIKVNSTAKNQELYYWYVNDVLQGVNENLLYNYNGSTSFEIKQVAESLNGCYDTLKQMINTTKVALSPLSDINICKGKNVVINPDGDFLHFYIDQNLTQLVHKGANLTLDSVTTDTTFYIVNNEGLEESDPITVTVYVSDLKAGISANVMPLNLYDGNEVTFTSTDELAVSWLWLVNHDSVSIEKSPAITFDNIDTYQISLIITDAIGCMDSITLLYEVVNITGLDEMEGLKIYPNPVRNNLNIDNLSQSIQIQLIDNLGRVLYSATGTRFNIDMGVLHDGLYHLQIKQGSYTYWKKIIKQD